MSHAVGYAVKDQDSEPARFAFERRELRSKDVAIDIKYCGICHSDIHQARNHWGNSMYPMVPGHEIVGIVSGAGAEVTKFKAGDRVAVGCFVDSCRKCDPCRKGEEQLCREMPTFTYNSTDRETGAPTFGGYSDHIVVDEQYVLTLPDALDMAQAAPIVCAGITTYSPLKKWGVNAGTRVAVAGLGGLGHMAVKLAIGMGATVTVITTSPSKEADARALGAHNVLLASDEEAFASASSSFDLIIDTIPVSHDVAPYLNLLDIDGTLVLVGAVEPIPSFHAVHLLGGRRNIASSPIGGIAETQELLDFCAQKNILPETELIAIEDVADAWRRMDRADVKYRFVIDMATLGKKT